MDTFPLATLNEEHTVAKEIIRILSVLSADLRGQKSVSLVSLKELIQAISDVLECHHKKEMEVFSVLVQDDDLDRRSLVEVLKEEHNLGYEYLFNIMRIINDPNHDHQQRYQLMPFHIDQFSHMLGDHIQKEEREFFPLIKETLSDDQQKELSLSFKMIDRKYNNKAGLALIHRSRKQYL